MSESFDVTGGAASSLFGLIGAPIAKQLGGQWKRVQWEFAEKEYRKRIASNLSRTRLLGSAGEIDVEHLYTDVYFLPESSASRRYSASALSYGDFLEISSNRDQERFSASEALRQFERLYILGTPGAGKSTFLRHVALSAAKGKINGIPIFISLKEWADSRLSFIDKASYEFDICGFSDATPVVEGLLASGAAILLLDGLDEVTIASGQRDTIVRSIIEIERKFPKTRIILTCRTSANDHSFSAFKYVEMADFSKTQQEHFIRQWFAQTPEKCNLLLDQFNGDNANALRDLGKKPLFMAFLCIAFDQTLDFPRSKSALHAEAIDILLSRWDSSRSIQRDQYGLRGAQRKKQFLSILALRLFEQDRYVANSLMIGTLLQSYVQKLPAGDQLLEAEPIELARSLEAAHGIIVERAVGLFSFSHLSIQEYFTALGLVDKKAMGIQWSELLPHDSILNPRWREVILHIGSVLPSGEDYFEFLLEQSSSVLGTAQAIKRLISLIEYTASTLEFFDKFAGNPREYLSSRYSTNDHFHEEFYPSPRLSNSITRLERSVFYVIRQHREHGRAPSDRLMILWRRVEVLREVISLKEGFSRCAGILGDTEFLDRKLADYLDAQDVLVLLLDDLYISNRDAAIGRVLSSTSSPKARIQ